MKGSIEITIAEENEGTGVQIRTRIQGPVSTEDVVALSESILASLGVYSDKDQSKMARGILMMSLLTKNESDFPHTKVDMSAIKKATDKMDGKIPPQ